MHRQTVGVDCAPGAGRSGVLDRVKGTAQAVRSIRAFGAEAGPHGWRVSAHRREDAVVPPSLLTVAPPYSTRLDKALNRFMIAIPLWQRWSRAHAVGVLQRPIQSAIPAYRPHGFKARDARL